ncbi:hypothetical protein D3C87_1813830 [compost metagenome]
MVSTPPVGINLRFGKTSLIALINPGPKAFPGNNLIKVTPAVLAAIISVGVIQPGLYNKSFGIKNAATSATKPGLMKKSAPAL